MSDPIVLFVDDEPPVLAAMMRALRKQPYRIFTANSGEQAIEIMNARRIDLIVSDEKMSGMQGTELLSWVAENYPEVPRIMLTGGVSLENTSRVINEAKVFKLFIKPCPEEELAQAIMEGIDLAREQTSSDDSLWECQL